MTDQLSAFQNQTQAFIAGDSLNEEADVPSEPPGPHWNYLPTPDPVTVDSSFWDGMFAMGHLMYGSVVYLGVGTLVGIGASLCLFRNTGKRIETKTAPDPPESE